MEVAEGVQKPNVNRLACPFEGETAGLLLDSLGLGGAATAAGVALSAADQSVLDSLLKGWKPSQFVEVPLKEFKVRVKPGSLLPTLCECGLRCVDPKRPTEAVEAFAKERKSADERRPCPRKNLINRRTSISSGTPNLKGPFRRATRPPRVGT